MTTPETPATPITEAGRFLLAAYDERPTNTLRVGILAIEAHSVAAWLASEGAEQALAHILTTVAWGTRTSSQLARALLTALREGA